MSRLSEKAWTVQKAVLTLVLSLLLVVHAAPASAGSLLLVGGGNEGADGDTSGWPYAAYSWYVGRACSGGPNGGNCRIAIVDYVAYPTCHVPDVGYCAFFESIGATLGLNVIVEPFFVKRICSGGDGPDCLEADASQTFNAIAGFDGIWLRGGDQSRYYDEWVDTLTEDAIAHRFLAGGVVGGTSAGAMILSEHVSIGSAASYDATSDPFHAEIDLRDDMFAGTNTVLPGVIVDTHFTERARLGRSAIFVGRTIAVDGVDLLGIGIDSETALAISADGIASVHGQGAVSFLRATETTLLGFAPGQPPHLTALAVDQLTEGFSYDLSERRVMALPPQAQPASSPAPATAYGATIVSGRTSSDRLKGSKFVDWTGAPDVSNALVEGELTLHDGTGHLDPGIVMTLLESSSAMREVRAGGPQWAIKEDAAHALIVYADGDGSGEYGRVEVHPDATLEILPPSHAPEESVIVVDCMGMQWVAQSSWDVNGNGKPRQSVALTPCHLHLINSTPGQSIYDATSHGVSDQPIGQIIELTLGQASGATTLRFRFDLPGAAYFQVIRGETTSLGSSGELTQLGTVSCIAASGSPFDVYNGQLTDTENPLPGTAWFYLVRGARDPGVHGSYDGPGAVREESPPGGCE